MNRGGRLLVNFIEKRKWMILNGNTNGNEEREYTFTGKVKYTVIDYIIKIKRQRNG